MEGHKHEFRFWFPRTRGDRPYEATSSYTLTLVPPRGRVEGRTFDFTFDLPGKPEVGKPAKKRSKRTPPQKGQPKSRQPKRRPELSAAEVEAKREERLEYERRRAKSPDRREQNRLHAQERRRKAIEEGLCVACRAPAIPEQSRCPTCAEQHRVDRRRWQANRRAANQQTTPTQS